MTQQQKSSWQFIGHSVRGASHLRDGKPNQDAIFWRVGKNGPGLEEREGTARVVEGLPLIAAIADGHGSERYVYSDRGARFAVEVAVELLNELVAEYNEPSRAYEAAKQELAKNIVKRWKKRVSDDIAASSPNPLSTDDATIQTDPLSARTMQGANDYTPYGATLLAVAVAPAYIVYLQLGDGDILAVTAEGAVERPIKKDDSLIANETHSLCQANAEGYLRIGFRTLGQGALPPALIMLSTDGYANSYADDRDFYAVANDYLTLSNERGLDLVRKDVPVWLNEISEGGSGDDITLALIKHDSMVMEKPREALDAEGRRKIESLDSTLSDFDKRHGERESVREQKPFLMPPNACSLRLVGVAALCALSLAGVAAMTYLELFAKSGKDVVSDGNARGSPDSEPGAMPEPSASKDGASKAPLSEPAQKKPATSEVPSHADLESAQNAPPAQTQNTRKKSSAQKESHRQTPIKGERNKPKHSNH